jgi:hypothetical protein
VSKVGLDLICPSTDDLKLIIPESKSVVPEFFSLSTIFKKGIENRTLIGIIEKVTCGKGSFLYLD